jgi:hypothetical protein
MDRYKIKSAIRSLLPLQSRLFKYALTIAFLLMVLVSCWPQALAKIPFVPSIHRDLQGNWEGEDNYITFEDSYLNTRSNDFAAVIVRIIELLSPNKRSFSVTRQHDNPIDCSLRLAI